MTAPLETWRLFLAIPLPAEVQAELELLQNRLQRPLGSVIRWVRPAQIHLTLRFLGNVTPGQVAPLEEALRSAPAGPRLNLCLGEPGSFPDPRRPRVIFIGLQGDLAGLENLQQQISQASQPWGDNHEQRAFKPHLTLGRTREGKPPPQSLPELFHKLQVAPAAWVATRFELIQSTLSPQGPIHRVLSPFPLA